jgi:MscS family membrane protein
MRFCSTLLLLVLCAAAADPLNRDSPQSSVTAFLEACRQKDYRRASRYLDLRRLQANQRSTEGVRLAEQLDRILESDTRFDEAALSRDDNGPPRQVVAVFRAEGRDVPLEVERVEFRPGASVWLFTPDSVDLIPKLAQTASDSPVEKYLPAPLVAWKFLDVPLWQWMAFLMLGVLLLGLSRIFCGLLLLWAAPAVHRMAPSSDPALLNEFTAPLRLLVVALAFRAGVEWIAPVPRLSRFLDHAAELLVFVAIAWLCMKAVDAGIARIRGVLRVKHQTFAYSVLPLASRVLKILIAVLAGLTVLSNWGYNTTTILAGLGVGGLAVALAAQKTIENLFGGVAVITDRPVVVGDFCKYDKGMGTVEDIGLRSTRIRTPDRTLVTIPNGAFSSMTLENFSRKDKTWFHLTLNLRRDTTPDQVREILRSITNLLKNHPKMETGAHPVRFAGIGTYSLDLEVDAYIAVTSDDELLPIQEGLYLQILDAVQSAGTALALPTQEYTSSAAGPARNGAAQDTRGNGTPVAHSQV